MSRQALRAAPCRRSVLLGPRVPAESAGSKLIDLSIDNASRRSDAPEVLQKLILSLPDLTCQQDEWDEARMSGITSTG